MISALRGKIRSMNPLTVHLETFGVTYEVHTPLYVTENLLADFKEQNEVTLFTRVIYTETSQSLYGFLSEEEARLFDFLRGLHGIGPKIIISLLSNMEADQILGLLEESRPENFTKIPGVGKTKAQKIVFEAGQKKKKLAELRRAIRRSRPVEAEEPVSGSLASDDLAQEIIEEALGGLGFQKKEIDRAAALIEKSSERPAQKNTENVQEWVRLFLKYL